MPRYAISFEAEGFAVATEPEYYLGWQVAFGSTKVSGVDEMAIEVETNSPAFTRDLVVVGKSGTRIPRPVGAPTPVWTGTDTPLASVAVVDDGWKVIVTPREVPGAFTVGASVPGVPWGAEVPMDVTIVQEAPDHLELVEPAA